MSKKHKRRNDIPPPPAPPPGRLVKDSGFGGEAGLIPFLLLFLVIFGL